MSLAALRPLRLIDTTELLNYVCAHTQASVQAVRVFVCMCVCVLVY